MKNESGSMPIGWELADGNELFAFIRGVSYKKGDLILAFSGIGCRGNVLLRSPYAGYRNPGFCTRIQTNALMPNTRSKSRMR